MLLSWVVGGILGVCLKKGTEVKSAMEIFNIYKNKEDIKDKSGS